MADSKQIKAKSLIDTFEKGEAFADNGPEHPEIIESEIASPGTAKNLRSMFERQPLPDEKLVIRRKKPVVVSKEEIKEVKEVVIEEKAENSVRHQKDTEKKVVKQDVIAEIIVESVPLPKSNKQAESARQPETKQKAEIVKQAESKNLPSRKRVLLVFSTEDEGSIEYDLVDTARRHFEETGCDVVVSDLHGQQFNPVVSRKDIVGCVSVAQAYERGHLAEDIVKEQEKLSSADLVVIIYAWYMHGVPAIVKGWLDRVLCVKYAYDVEKGAMFDNGLMKGKRVMVCQTHGGPSSLLTGHGILGDMNVYLYPLEWAILRFCGFDVLQAQLYFNTHHDNEARRKSHLTEWRGRLEGVWLEHPKQFLSLSQFEANKGYSLSEAAKLDLETRSMAVSVGHHLGKPIPAFLPPPEINVELTK